MLDRCLQLRLAPDALEARFAHNTAAARTYLLDTPTELIGRHRPYQRDCILAVEQAITSGKHDMMVAMATGTGKTYLTVAQVYRLLESKLVRCILFLVDRKALAAQAVREFNAFNTPKGNKFTQEYEVYSQRFQREDFGDDTPFDPKVLPNEYLTAPTAAHTFVYISTIQRMARNLFGAEASFGQIGGDADLEEDADRLEPPVARSPEERRHAGQPRRHVPGCRSGQRRVDRAGWHDAVVPATLFTTEAQRARRYTETGTNWLFVPCTSVPSVPLW